MDTVCEGQLCMTNTDNSSEKLNVSDVCVSV